MIGQLEKSILDKDLELFEITFSVKTCDYSNRVGIRWVSWEEFVELSGRLTEKLSYEGVNAIVGVARAGLFPATSIACALRCELYPVCVSRRENDEVVHSKPVWKVPVSEEVEDKIVAVVDEISDSGQTLAIVSANVLAKGAKRVMTASLISHSQAKPRVDICATESDEFVVFPWNQRVFIDGKWQAHPEVLAGLRAQED